MAYGITDTGFVKKTQEQILADVEAAEKAVWGALLDVGASTALGQFNGVNSAPLAELWELLEALYHANDPDAAAGVVLDMLCALTGTVRPQAKASTVALTLNLNAGATVNAGALVEHSTRPDIRFTTDAPVTNSGGSAADFTVQATCTQTGPIAAAAGALTVIVNAVSGWNSVTNAADAVLGRNVATDIETRALREAQLARRGGSTVGAIEADLLALTDMRDVKVLENTNDVTVDSIPPHAINALIDDGDVPAIANNTIAQAIWETKAAGIQTSGGSSGTATDGNGDDHTVYFDRVSLRPVYIAVTVTTNDDYPLDGDAQIKAAIVAAGSGLGIADTVIALALRAACLSVAGVTDVPTFLLDFSPAPAASANLSPGTRARATFSTVNVSVTS